MTGLIGLLVSFDALERFSIPGDRALLAVPTPHSYLFYLGTYSARFILWFIKLAVFMSTKQSF
jgi:hypothetical protein